MTPHRKLQNGMSKLTVREFEKALDDKGADMIEVLKHLHGAHTDTELAGILGLTPKSISNARKGGKVPHAWIMHACGVLGVPVSMILRLSPEEMLQVDRRQTGVEWMPILEARRVPPTADEIADGDFPSRIIGHVPMRMLDLHGAGAQENERLALIYAPEPAMEPEIKQGDLVLLSLSRNEVTQGGLIYVLAVNPGQAICGRVFPIGQNRIRVEFHRHEPLELDLDEVTIIAQVLGAWRNL